MQLPNQHSTLLRRSTHEAVFLASSMIDRCAEAARVTLEEAENKSTIPLQRQQLADAMVALARHRAKMRTRFPSCIETAINHALEAIKDTDLNPTPRPSNLASLESVTLMAEAEVSQFVETSRLQQTVLPVVEERLTRLDTLMSSALGLPVVRADLNPMRPEVLCGALMEVIEELGEPPEARNLMLRHLTRPFADELNRLYEVIIRLLEEKGIQEARYRLRLTPGAMQTASNIMPLQAMTGPLGQGMANLAAGAPMQGQAQAFQMPAMADLASAEPAVPYSMVHDFLYQPQWVAHHDAPLPPSYYEAVRREMQTCAAVAASTPMPSDRELYAAQQERRALPVMERPPQELDVQAVLPQKVWGEVASPQARTQTLVQLKSQAKKVSQVIGLDAVRALIDQVAGDVRVLPPVREAFVALEPALLRLAMSDPRFMGDETHPARRLVESIAQRSFKYNDEFSKEFAQFIEPVRRVVRELDAQKDATAHDFDNHLQDLESRWEEEDQSDSASHKNGLQSIHFAHDRQALADKVAWGFSLRSDVEGAPKIVLDFLYNTWALVIAHAQLTDTRGQLDPGGYLAVVTDLLWSVNHEAAMRQPAHLFEIVPHIVQTLRRGLEMLGHDPKDSNRFFDALMRYHKPVLRLRRVRSALDAEASGAPTSSMMDLNDDLPDAAEAGQGGSSFAELKADTSEQPWLAQRELAAAGFMPSSSPELEPAAAATPGKASVPSPARDQAGAAATANAAAPGADDDEQQARHRADLARLREDTWVDLFSHGEWLRAKLTWTSGNGSLFMFVSHGGQPHTMTRRSCEKLLRNGHLRLVDSSEVVNKALSEMKDRKKRRRATAAA